jgi:hypothetical protein
VAAADTDTVLRVCKGLTERASWAGALNAPTASRSVASFNVLGHFPEGAPAGAAARISDARALWQINLPQTRCPYASESISSMQPVVPASAGGRTRWVPSDL